MIFITGLFCLLPGPEARAWNVTDLANGTNYIASPGTYTNNVYFSSYSVTNDSATVYSNIWVKMGAFTNGAGAPNIGPGGNSLNKKSLGFLGANSSRAFYFCMSGTNSPSSATNAIGVYDGDPASGGVLLTNIVFTKNYVILVTQAANGGSAGTNYLSTTTPVLGAYLVITSTFTVGSSAKNGLYASYPAVSNNWDASTFSMVSNTFYVDTSVFADQMVASIPNTKPSTMTNVATFRIINTKTSSTVISAGGFVNTGNGATPDFILPGTAGALAPIPPVTNSVVLTNWASAAVAYTNTTVYFTNKFSNTGPLDVNIADLVCTLPRGFVYAGNATFAGAAISSPDTNSFSATNYVLAFSQGYVVPANSTASLVFAAMPTNALDAAGNVTNRTVLTAYSAYGLIGTNHIDLTYDTTDNATPTNQIQVRLNPVANNDGPYAAIENTTLNVPAASGVLSNDIEPNSLPFGVSSFTAATFGTVNVTANGSFTYLTSTTNLVDSFTYTLTNSDGRTATATVNLTVTAIPSAAQSTVSASPSSVTADGATTSTVTVTLKDLGGHPVMGKTVTLAKTSGAGSPTITTTQGTTDTSGVATFTVKSITAAADVFTATDTTDSLTVTQTATVTFTPGPASQLAFTTQPRNGTGGSVLSPQPVVTLQDAFGNTVTGTVQNVTLAIQNNAGGGTLSGTTTVAVNTATGTATFSGLSIDKIGTGYTLTATGSTVSTTPGVVVSGSFSVSVGPAAQLAFTTQPSASTVAGVAFAQQPAVAIEDAGGNVVTSGADSTVNVALTLTTGTGTLGGTTAMNAVAGVANFSGKGLNINLVGSDKVLTATATVAAGTKTTTTSPAFAITVAAANAYRITDAAGGTPSPGTGDQLTITLVDAFGNTETGFSGDTNLTFSGLSTADDGTHPTVTSKTGAPVALGTSTTFTFASGVSSAGGSLVAYKAEGPVALNATDGSSASTSTGGAGRIMTIANVNPVALNQTVTRGTNASLKILKSDLLAGATDVNHDIINFSSAQSPSGDATVMTNSLYVFYLPGTTQNGATFTYTVSDGHGGTDTKTVTVNVVYAGGAAQNVAYNAGGVTITFAGIPGTTYDVQRATDASFTANLTVLATTNAPSAGVFLLSDPSPPSPSGYYRLIQH